MCSRHRLPDVSSVGAHKVRQAHTICSGDGMEALSHRSRAGCLTLHKEVAVFRFAKADILYAHVLLVWLKNLKKVAGY